MADFDLSLLATMDSTSAEQGARAVSTALDGVTAAEQRNDAATEQSTRTEEAATKADKDRSRALDDVLKAIDPVYASQKRLNDLLQKATQLNNAGVLSTERLAEVQKLYNNAMKGGAVSAGQARASYSNFGAQMSDIISTLTLGINPVVVFGQQAGQTAAALSTFGGTVGKVATFLSGPWGAAVLGAITVLGMLATKFLESGKESDRLTETLDFQKLSLTELTKAIRENLIEQRKSIALSYEKAQASRTEAAENLNAAITMREKTKAMIADTQASAQLNAGQGTGGVAGAGGSLLAAGMGGTLEQQDKNIDRLGELLRLAQVPISRREAAAATDKLAASTLKYEKAEADLTKQFTTSKISREQYQKQLDDLYAARERDADGIRKAESDAKKEATARERAAKAAERQRIANEKFGDKSAEAIQRINEQFDEQPSFIDKAAQATRQLDTIIEQLEKRHPPGFAQMIADAQRAKGVIEQSLLKPLNDVFEASQRRQTLAGLDAANRRDEADALQIIWQLESKLGPLANEYRQQVLDTVVAEREVNEAIEQRIALQDDYLSATRSVRQEIEAILSGTGKLSNFKQIFKNLQGKVLAEQLFGDVFRDLDKYVRENTAIKSSVDIMSSETERAGKAAGSFADILNAASATVKSSLDGPASSATAGGGIAAVQGAFDEALGKSADQTGAAVAEANEIVVTAIKGGAGGLTPERYFDEMFKRLGTPILEGLDKTFGTDFFSKLSGVFGGAVSGYLTAGPAGGILGALKGIKGLPEGIQKGLGDALKGAQTGTAVAGIGNMLGLGLSTGGSQVGGALGGALGSVIGIPGLDIAGSLAGGLIGKLFKTSRTAGATITGLDDVLLAGKDSKNYGTASGLAGSVTGSLANIAKELGATVGAFRVTIGTRGNDFRVNTSGGSLKTGNGAVNFGSDEAGAIAYAIADAIADGAIKGISPAVANALKMNKDIDTALSEAIKVQDLENDIKYMGNAIQEEFDNFAKTAAERVELAKKYGVDLLGVEALNAKERNELLEKAMEAQVGSLQDLLDEIRYGSMFEGSAIDQRNALLEEIAAVRDKAAAGEDGAADTLASLLEQFNTLSKSIYGTTGGFAADRDNIIATATDVIAQAQQRINDAASSSGLAAAATNTALNENNDQNDQIIAQLTALNLSQTQLNSLMSAILSGNSTAAAAALARTS